MSQHIVENRDGHERYVGFKESPSGGLSMFTMDFPKGYCSRESFILIVGSSEVPPDAQWMKFPMEDRPGTECF